MNFFGPTEKAVFLERPNRFTLICDLRGTTVRAFLPNPGRLWELLLPGAPLYLESRAGADRLPYTVVAIERDQKPILVHTHRTNDLAGYLLQRNLVPGLEGSKIIRREYARGRSRFDFLLQKGKKEIVLEVKSCTLFGRDMAMFPDAVTARGRRHLEELAGLSGRGAVLFLIYSPRIRFFMPEYHTDLPFTRALLAARKKISILPLAVEVRPDLTLGHLRLLQIPWGLLEKEAQDRGCYILILRLPARAVIEIGHMGKKEFQAGYYLYVGSARKDLARRIERHRRIRKNQFWHIDYLRPHAQFRAALPIRTAEDLECPVARAVKEIAHWEVPDFGSSDCSCTSHLYGVPVDPVQTPSFISLLQYFRMDRLPLS